MDRGSGQSVSVWMKDEPLPRYPAIERNAETDVCVIGGGIAGLSVAYELVGAGRSVIVIEDGAIGSGETSRTTAHVTYVFDDRYALVERLHGEDAARLVAESHTAAIDEIERIVRGERIECQFERLDGYLFVPPGDPLDVLEREFAACRKLGMEVSWRERAPLEGFETGRCLCFANQAQFHPLRYLAGLAGAIVRRGGRIYTGTHATGITDGGHGARARVETQQGFSVTAEHVIVATNTPVNDLLTIHTKQYPYRTFVIGARVPRESVTPALYWDTPHPYHYARLVPSQAGDEVLIVGGEDHKTGQRDDADERFARLEAWSRARFPQMGPVEYQWSGQVMEPMDTVAYIGRNPGDERLWVVTGDSGNGMTHGALAGILLRDLILGRDPPWAKLYDPSRKSIRAALEFTKENVNMAAQYASWVTGGDVADEAEILPGCGAIVRHGLKKLAVYRDPSGGLHRFSATCPHLGAIVNWNSEEKTWDCPAHGSRFSAEGKVLNGPANGDLAPAEEEPAEATEKHSTRA